MPMQELEESSRIRSEVAGMKFKLKPLSLLPLLYYTTMCQLKTCHLQHKAFINIHFPC